VTTILGIDPGSRKTGFGVIKMVNGKAQYIASGVIRLPVDQALPIRLGVLFDSINQIIDAHAPTEMSVEQVFLAKSADAALKLGQARGAAMVAGVQRGLLISEYSARQIKQSVVGTGAAVKTQVQHMVKVLLALPASPKEDAADALAAALCHAHTRATLRDVDASRIVHGRWR
jgi:crossover junction endodeoxyribonuclease RuvC